MGRFSVDVKLANSVDISDARRGLIPSEKVRQIVKRGVVDTGATRLVIPASVVTAWRKGSRGSAGTLC
jgi:predicted aspartyl protease